MNKNIRNLILFAVAGALSITIHAQDWTDGSFTLWNSFGSQGTADGQFQQADGIAVDENGLIYVSDYQLHRIQVFQADGTFVRKWGAQGSGDGQFQNPRGLDIGPDGNLYVCDWGNHRICVFQPDGTFVRSWGTSGTGDRQFKNPYRISVNGSRQVFVADYNNNRVQVFSLTGVFVRKFNTLSKTEGLPERPYAIAALDHGEVVVGQRSAEVSYNSPAFLVKYDLNGNRGVSWQSSVNNAAIYGGLDVNPQKVLVTSSVYQSWPNIDSAWYTTLRIYDDNGSLYKDFSQATQYRYLNVAFSPDQSIVGISDYYTVHIRRWMERTVQNIGKNFGCWPKVEKVEQRAGYPYLDIDFRANSDNGTTNANVAMCAFLDGNIDLASLIPMQTFVDNTGTNLGANVELSSDLKRVTWNMAADWSADSGNVQVLAFAQEGSYYLPFNFLTIPEGEVSSTDWTPLPPFFVETNHIVNAFQICRTPVTSDDLKFVWMFLIASNDSDVELVDGTVYGTSGSYDGVALASDSGTTTSGKDFLWERMGLRDPTSDELTWAKEATIPGVQKWTPRYKVGGRPSYINEFGLDTGATTGFWAVKQ